MPALPTLPVAVSPLVRDLFDLGPGPARGATTAATVLAAFPTALYLHVPAAHGRAHCVLPVLTSDALRLPTGLVLARAARDVVWPVVPGDEVIVGDGRVRLPGVDLIAVREWHPPRVRAHDSWDARLLPTGDVALADACAELVRAARDGADVRSHVHRLVGAGPGLTPSGDDALCGVLLALRAFAPDDAGDPGDPGDLTPRARIADATRAAAHRTTCLSASLLRAAIDGYATPQVVHLVSALSADPADPAAQAATAHPGPTGRNEPPIQPRTPAAAISVPPLGPALAAVLAIGHTSGRDLVSGIAGTLEALATGSQTGSLSHPPTYLP